MCVCVCVWVCVCVCVCVCVPGEREIQTAGGRKNIYKCAFMIIYYYFLLFGLGLFVFFPSGSFFSGQIVLRPHRLRSQEWRLLFSENIMDNTGHIPYYGPEL